MSISWRRARPRCGPITAASIVSTFSRKDPRPLAVAHLRRGAAERRILLELLGEHAAAVVDDRHLIRQEALHGVGHEVADRVDLINLEPATPDIHKDGSGGFHALFGQQQPVFRLHDHHPRRAHALQLRDGAGKFALHRAQVIRPLHEIGKSELTLVEDFKADALAARQALARKIHPELVNHARGHLHGTASGGDLVRNVLRLQIADDGGGVLVAKARI